MNLASVLFVTVASGFLIGLPRRWAALPLMVGTTYMTLGPSLDVGPFSFTVLRILIAIGVIRIISRGERFVGPWHAIDRIIVLWAVVAILSSFFHKTIPDALVFRLGMTYNALGLYFLLRVFIQGFEDVLLIGKMVIVVLLPIAAAMVIEARTGQDLFSVLGGVPEWSEIRNGRIRAQGPFAHSILAGTVGAVCLPLAVMFWTRNRKLALAGIIATGLMVVSSRSSGPMMSAILAAGGLGLWWMRHWLRLLRWSALLMILGLCVLMNAPIYYILARIDLTGSSTGWHRAVLMESAVNNIDEWWLAGTDLTRHWTPNSGYSGAETDITNHYIRMGVWGGLPMLLLFIGLLVIAFRALGDALDARQDFLTDEQFVIWALGCSLFAHAATMVSVSYFDQSVFFLYLLLAAIGSLHRETTLDWQTWEIVDENLPVES